MSIKKIILLNCGLLLVWAQALAAVNASANSTVNSTANSTAAINVNATEEYSTNVSAKPLPNTTKIDKIIAVVNSEIITQSEIDKKVKTLKLQFAASGIAAPSDEELHQQVLDKVIDDSLELQLAKRNNITIEDADVDQAIKMILKANKLDMSQLHEALAKDGMTMAQLREQLREQIVIQKVQQQAFGKEVAVDESEIQSILRNPPKRPSAIDEYHVIDYLVPIPDKASPAQLQAAKDTAVQVADKITNKQKIDSKTVTTNDLGFRTLPALPSIFATSLMKMSAGSVSEPLEAPNGYHVLRLVAVKEHAGNTKLTREQAQEIAYRQKVGERLNAWLKELRAGAYIKVSN
jgi:peptidyl-prolyl cis-trans isomerase SurA